MINIPKVKDALLVLHSFRLKREDVQMKNQRKRYKVKSIVFTTIILLCIITGVSIFSNYKNLYYSKINEGNKTEIDISDRLINKSSNKVNDDWRLILVNAWNKLPNDYDITLKTITNDAQVDERIYPDLQEMFEAAEKDGIYLLPNSAYRTNEEQESIFSNKVKTYMKQGYSKKDAKELAKTWAAMPGTSEHQLGLAIDIIAQKDKSTNEDVYPWLKTNGYKYGFILRYPADKAQITGVNYEPWHYRYVGKEVAKEIYEQGISLEEYLETRK